MLTEYHLQTPNEGMLNITRQVQTAVAAAGLQDGICVVHCPHTTAGMTINENADPDVVHDLLLALDDIYCDRREFLHAEGNSAAHLKASFVGNSVTVPVQRGKLVLGVWQGIYFCEFDGPRSRHYFVQTLEAIGKNVL